MLKIALIVGSTRPGRFADVPVRWFLDGAQGHEGMEIDTLDLRDQGLPFYQEEHGPRQTGGAYGNPAAETWRKKIGAYDGYIVTVAEFNHGPVGELKNALDSAYFEWARKPISFIGYGGVGAARAIEHLRGIAIELQMAPIKAEINIAMEPFMAVRQKLKTLDDYPYLADSRRAVLEETLWWGNALRAARMAHPQSTHIDPR